MNMINMIVCLILFDYFVFVLLAVYIFKIYLNSHSRVMRNVYLGERDELPFPKKVGCPFGEALTILVKVGYKNCGAGYNIEVQMFRRSFKRQGIAMSSL